MIKKAGFGGGCHWCTEAVFSSLKGVTNVQQGWVNSVDDNSWLSEGVILEFDDAVISLETLVAVHLYTHASTSAHSMRGKYRSAVYVFTDEDNALAQNAIAALQPGFEKTIITQVLPFNSFEQSREELLNYYYSNPKKPFCENYINPKLQLIRERFDRFADIDKIKVV